VHKIGEHSQRALKRGGSAQESNPPIYSRVDEHAEELCRLTNDAIAATCRRDLKRFKAFAHLPFNNMDLALKEMARALDELHFCFLT
jgi:hypothetical protein